MASGAESASLVGELVYGYVVDAVIGQGSQGDIYRLRHPTLPNRLLALKVLRGGQRASEEIRGRFLQDALAASRVGGHGVVQPVHVDQLPDGTPYIVMELAPGRSLDRVLNDGPLPVAVALAIAAAVAETMARVHERGIVHRDLKPGNVMVELDGGSVGAVKLLDFGVALVPNDLRQVKTRENQFFGTACYMAPEMASGRPVDGKADVFSLGAVLFEMLSGSTPFDSMIATVGEFPAPSVAVRRAAELGPVPIEVAEAVAIALEKKTATRPTMTELHDRLRALLASLANPSPAGSGGPTWKSMVVPQPASPGGRRRRGDFTTTDQELQKLFKHGPFSVEEHLDPNAESDSTDRTPKSDLEDDSADSIDPMGATVSAADAQKIDPRLTPESMRDTAPLDRDELRAIAAGPAQKTVSASLSSAPTAILPSPEPPAAPSLRTTAPIDLPSLATAQLMAPGATRIVPPASAQTETWRVNDPGPRPRRTRVLAIAGGFLFGALAVGAVIVALLWKRETPLPDEPAPTVAPIVAPKEPPIAAPKEPPIAAPKEPPIAVPKEPPIVPPKEPPSAPADPAPQGWESIKAPTRESLYDLFGDGRGHFVAVGGAGTILRSTDHGASFQKIDLDGDHPPLYGVWGSGDQLWAVGDRGTVLHSSDGGERWTRQTAPTNATLAGVWGASRDDLYVVGNPSTILHSTDGGATWQKQSPHNGNGLRRVWGRGGSVWVVGWGETILRTSDGGAHWVTLRSEGVGTLFDLFGIGDEVLAVGSLHPPGSGTRSRDDLILRSIDAGAHFRVEPSPTRYPLYAVGGSAPDALLVAGPAATLLAWDGHEWTREPLPVRGAKVSRIVAAPHEATVLVGNDGLILRRAPAN